MWLLVHAAHAHTVPSHLRLQEDSNRQLQLVSTLRAGNMEYESVCSLMRANGFDEEVVSIFKENKIDEETLLELNNDDLKELSVTALGDRKKIMKMKEHIRVSY